MSAETLSKRAVRHAFECAAPGYDHAATVQRETCRRLAELAARHPPVVVAPRILDAGCGTGYGFSLLRKRYPAADCVALDLAPAMLRILRRDASSHASLPLAVAGDIERLPLRRHSFDAIWSSLALQWCAPARALQELARISRPGAIVWLATLGPGTLRELRSAFAAVDGREHTIAFHAPEHWRTAAENAGFRIVAYQREERRAGAATLRELLRDIKAVGAHTLSARHNGLLGRDAWRKLNESYERYRDDQNRLPASYDTIMLILRKNA